MASPQDHIISIVRGLAEIHGLHLRLVQDSPDWQKELVAIDNAVDSLLAQLEETASNMGDHGETSYGEDHGDAATAICEALEGIENPPSPASQWHFPIPAFMEERVICQNTAIG